jgi:hypothetical protein
LAGPFGQRLDKDNLNDDKIDFAAVRQKFDAAQGRS